MTSVAIVGAGIGGLTLGNLLTQSGWTVDIYERSPGLPEMGSALGMWPDALDVLRPLGLVDPIREAGHPQGSAEIRDPVGRLLSHLPARGETIMISRDALLRTLRTSALRIHFGSPVTDPTALDHDIIVGADGISSATRTFVSEKPVIPKDLGVSVILGQFEGATDMFTEYWGPGQSFGITPLSDSRRDWHAAYRIPASGTPAASLETSDPLAFVSRQYGSWNDEVVGAVAATIPDTVMRYHVRTIPRLRSWHRDNIVLIGDAVHAMAPNLGRGACETILDAAALATALGAPTPDADASTITRTFAEYQSKRRGPAYRTAAASRVMCRMGMLDHGAGLRNLALRAMP